MDLRKGIALFCFVLFSALLLSACNNKNESDSKDGGSDGTTSISIMATLHTPEVPDDKVLNIIEETTGVKLDIEWVPDNNYNEKLNASFSTGTLPQVVSVGFEHLDQFREAIADDQFWEIGPYLDDYENLKNLKEDIVENTMIEGKVYGIYQGRPLSRQGIVYRKDWADNLGLSAPTTTDELFEMARAFTEDDPDGNGKDDTVGITDRGDLVYGAFKTIAAWFDTPNNWGEKDGELLPEFMFTGYLDTMNYMKDLRDNGYINQDFPITSKDDSGAMMKNGTSGIRIGGMADVLTLYNDAKDLDPDIEYDVHNRIAGPDGEIRTWSIPGFASLFLFPKSAIETEEELKDILAFYNEMMGPEVANLLYWGIEGEHYTIEEDMAKITEDQEKFDREVKPLLSLEVGEPETNGRYVGYETYEPKKKSEELFKDNDEFLIHDPTVTLVSETFILDGERLQGIIDDATYNYIIGEIDEDGFDKEVEKWKEQGGDKIIKEFNASRLD